MSANVVDVLQKALPIHIKNASRMKFLFDFEEGHQPITRVKTYRPEINVQCHDNIAHQVSTFYVGYAWSNPITLIQRGNVDSGISNEPNAIALLNEQYETEGIKTKTPKLGKDVTITDVGYTYVDVNMDWEDGDCYFKLNVLNPLTTFIIRSSYYLDNRPMMAVVYSEDDLHVQHFTCWTKDTRFDISQNKILLEELNPLGKIPVVEWIGNYDGMGVWEHEISEMDNLNLMISDFSNATEQNVQAIYHSNDIDFPEKITKNDDGTEIVETIKPKNGEWLQTYTTQDGKTPFVKPVVMDYDYASQLNNIITRRQLILEKCHIPARNDDSGGSTGVAMNSATGWSTLDVVSETIQACQESAKMEEVKLVLAAIKLSPFVPQDSPLLKLSAKDIQPNIKRLKLAEMSTKCNSLATLLSHGIDGLNAIRTVNLFSDPNQVYADSKELIDRYQTSIFDKQKSNNAVGGDGEESPNADRIMQDLSDQVSQSPNLQG